MRETSVSIDFRLPSGRNTTTASAQLASYHTECRDRVYPIPRMLNVERPVENGDNLEIRCTAAEDHLNVYRKMFRQTETPRGMWAREIFL